jgi:cation diffusion facilitator CzcD-associated flavoprotein CzcO
MSHVETESSARPGASAGTSAEAERFDVIVIGAGIAGMYQLYKLREAGFSVRVYETGTDVGGTWYWNRYPGARFDSESWSYGYSFSKELLQEWDWKEHFAGQPEILRYLQFVADKFDLRKDIRFSSRVESAVWDEATRTWDVRIEDGTRARAPFVVTAVGILSATQMPPYPGIESFRGESFHTSRWPHEPVDLRGKRVGVIGTGATAVQLITEIGKDVGHLTVFQRTPNYCAPLRNGPVTDEEQARIKATYEEIFRRTRETFAGFVHDFEPGSALERTPEEREALYWKRWNEPGFGKWLGLYFDIFTDEKANESIAEFVRARIRERVKDPKMAEKLVPKNHPYGAKRVPLESGYYEVFNQDNVTLVDVNETPIERITERGVATSDAEYELDVIVYATGFDAVTGPLTRMNVRGIGGLTFAEKWKDGPRHFLGMSSAGFPNLFTIVGPTNGSTFCNIPRCIEQNVEWVAETLGFLRERGITRIEANADAEDEWVRHVNELGDQTLLVTANSWFVGANTPGKARSMLMYAGGPKLFRERCDGVAANGYEGFTLS